MKISQILLLGLGLFTPLFVQDARSQQQQLWSQCTAVSPPALPDTVINACTSLIQSGQLGGQNLAIALAKRGWQYTSGKQDADRGLQDLNQAIALDRSSYEAWAHRCLAHGAKNQRDLAIEDCNRAIALNPADASAWAYRGDQFVVNGDLDHAISDYTEAIHRQPNWVWPLADRAGIYRRRGQLDLALQDFNRVIQVAPNLLIGYSGRAIVYGDRSEWDLAVADYQKAAQLAPSNTSIQTQLQQAQSARQAELDEYSRWFNGCLGLNSASNPEVAIEACDQALNHKRASANDRSRLTARRIDLQRVVQETTTFQRQWENCRAFVIQSCDAAVQSPKATAANRPQLIAWRAVRQKFDADVAACREGSVPACDMALSSAVASGDDQKYLRDWRAAASPWAKAWAFLDSGTLSILAVLSAIPTSTLAVSAIAILNAALFVFIYIRDRRHRRALDFATAPSPVAAPLSAFHSLDIGNASKPAVPNEITDPRKNFDRQGIKQTLRSRRMQFDI
jgi:tetratricopeptide (TPR) repeat protein